MSTHPYQDSTTVEDEGAILAADLGQNYCLLLQNHGLLVVGRTPAEAFIYHYYLEMACKIQVDILSCTDEPIEFSEEVLGPLLEWGKPEAGPHGEHEWPAHLRLLDRKYPHYKN